MAEPTVLDFGASHILTDREFFLGLDALARDDLDVALSHLHPAEVCGWGVKEVYNNIGSVLAEYGHDPLAAEYYARAAGMDKHYALPRWNVFRLFKRHGRYAEVREQFEQTIAATPEDFRAYGEMGFLLHNHLDDPDAAVGFWHESLHLKPDQPQIVEVLTESRLEPASPIPAFPEYSPSLVPPLH